ncbi:hypothetical protein NADFUDRAFT_53715 [Nadsonia fulvescens var. elongata DSM 6958]|uniref:Non-homologous end-joining factor 1 n=1 Tax=Nadsonia fulvescens var. elongata DSM 6958 TaxID=857566 RepID=A0A1E3PCC9_9ASCO|nr:hypothetical protein NADFUDRAFT_53715 [Nadsonia fulvescens var. elongata DSM 6958]
MSKQNNFIPSELTIPWIPLVENYENKPPQISRVPDASQTSAPPLLFYQGFFHDSGYRLVVSDLSDQVWIEEITSEMICDRLEAGEFTFDVTDDVKQLKVWLKRLSQTLITTVNTKRVISKYNSEMIVIEISEHLFTWSFHLSRLPAKEQPQFGVTNELSHITIDRNTGLLCLIDSLFCQVQGLKTLLTQKDYHIEHLRSQLHEETGLPYVPRRHLSSMKRFEEGIWLDDWKKVREVSAHKDPKTELVSIETVVKRSVGQLSDLWGFTASGKGVITTTTTGTQLDSLLTPPTKLLPRLSSNNFWADNDDTTDDGTDDEYDATLEPSSRTSDFDLEPAKMNTESRPEKEYLGFISSDKHFDSFLTMEGSKLFEIPPSSPPIFSSSPSELSSMNTQSLPTATKPRTRKWGMVTGRKRGSLGIEGHSETAVEMNHEDGISEQDRMIQRADERRLVMNARLSQKKKKYKGQQMRL